MRSVLFACTFASALAALSKPQEVSKADFQRLAAEYNREYLKDGGSALAAVSESTFKTYLQNLKFVKELNAEDGSAVYDVDGPFFDYTTAVGSLAF